MALIWQVKKVIHKSFFYKSLPTLGYRACVIFENNIILGFFTKVLKIYFEEQKKCK